VVEEDAAGGETTTHAYGKDEMVEEVKAVAEAEAVGTSVAKARMEGAEEVVAEAITVDAEALHKKLASLIVTITTRSSKN
jgi:hypothetical protein